jgi:hypothetical protein
MAAVVRNIAAAAHEAAVGMTFDHNHKVSVVHEGAASTEMMIAVVDAAHKVVVVAHMKGVGPGVVVHCLRAAPRRLEPWQQQLLAWMQALNEKTKKSATDYLEDGGLLMGNAFEQRQSRSRLTPIVLFLSECRLQETSDGQAKAPIFEF